MNGAAGLPKIGCGLVCVGGCEVVVLHRNHEDSADSLRRCAGDVCATHKTPVATLASSAALRRMFPSKNPRNPAASFR